MTAIGFLINVLTFAAIIAVLFLGGYLIGKRQEYGRFDKPSPYERREKSGRHNHRKDGSEA